MDFPQHPFWDFSIDVHQRPGVHEACLDLQVQYALDINLLFFCCWAGSAGGLLDQTRIETAIRCVDGWQEEIVRPIWKARWRLKPSFKSFPTEWTEILRKSLVNAELDAEHMEQLHLAHAIDFEKNQNASERIKASHGVANLCLYLKRFFDHKPMPLQKVVAPLLVLLSACFPGQGEHRLRVLLEEQLGLNR